MWACGVCVRACVRLSPQTSRAWVTMLMTALVPLLLLHGVGQGVVRFTHLAFWLLFLMLGSLAVSTEFNVHVCFLLVIALVLYGLIIW